MMGCDLYNEPHGLLLSFHLAVYNHSICFWSEAAYALRCKQQLYGSRQNIAGCMTHRAVKLQGDILEMLASLHEVQALIHLPLFLNFGKQGVAHGVTGT